MVRLSNWEARLAAYLEGRAGASLVWGKCDCCLFAAGAVEAMTGQDPMPEFRGKYRSQAGAFRALRTIGAGDLASTLSAKFEGRPIGHARRGDLVMHDGAVGVCIGADALFMPLEGAGLVRIPRRDWSAAWAV